MPNNDKWSWEGSQYDYGDKSYVRSECEWCGKVLYDKQLVALHHETCRARRDEVARQARRAKEEADKAAEEHARKAKDLADLLRELGPPAQRPLTDFEQMVKRVQDALDNGAAVDEGDVRALLDACLKAEAARKEAEEQADASALRYIEATNPGIDMDEVRRLRARNRT